VLGCWGVCVCVGVCLFVPPPPPPPARAPAPTAAACADSAAHLCGTPRPPHLRCQTPREAGFRRSGRRGRARACCGKHPGPLRAGENASPCTPWRVTPGGSSSTATLRCPLAFRRLLERLSRRRLGRHAAPPGLGATWWRSGLLPAICDLLMHWYASLCVLMSGGSRQLRTRVGECWHWAAGALGHALPAL